MIDPKHLAGPGQTDSATLQRTIRDRHKMSRRGLALDSADDRAARLEAQLREAAALPTRERRLALAHVLERAERMGVPAKPKKAGLAERAARLRACSEDGLVAMPADRPKQARWVTYHCEDRICPACHGRRLRGTRARLQRSVQCARSVRSFLLHVTLTAGRRGGYSSPAAALDAMQAALRKLVRLDLWDSVDGWFAGFEVEVGDDGSLHPHWHVLLSTRRPIWYNQAAYRVGQGTHAEDESVQCPTQTIQEAWAGSLGLSGEEAAALVVHARRVDERTSYEVTKYVAKGPTKPAEAESWPDARARSFGRVAAELAGRRLYRAGGRWYRVTTDPPGSAEPVRVATVAELQRELAAVQSAQRDAARAALAALRAWRRQQITIQAERDARAARRRAGQRRRGRRREVDRP